MAREVAARDPALHRARVPLAHAPGPHRRRVLRDPHHRALPAGHVRLQRRGAALVVARGLLLVRSTRHRPLPPVHARRRARLPGTARCRVSGTAVARARTGEILAPRDPAPRHRRHLPRRRKLRDGAGRRRGMGRRLPRRSDRGPGLLRRRRAALHRALPDGDIRFRARARSVGRPCGGLRASDAGRVPAVPSRPGWSGSCGRRWRGVDNRPSRAGSRA